MSKLNTATTSTARAARTAVNGAKVIGNKSRDTDAHTHYAEQSAQLRDEYLASQNVPSGTRLVVAAVSRLLAFSVSIYWGMEAAAILMVAAIALTGSGFIAFVVTLTAMLLAFSAAWQAASAVGKFIVDFDPEQARAAGRDLRVAAAKRVSAFKAFFKKSDIADPIAV